MENRFDVELLQEALDFLDALEEKARDKIIFNIHLARKTNNNKLFKKLTNDIWEFRTLHNKTQYRLFAFWDRRRKTKSLVIATHGIIKKTQKTPKKEIIKAVTIMKKYYEQY